MPDGAGQVSASGERKRRLRATAAFGSRVPFALLTEERAAFQRANAKPTTPDLGTCVLVSLAGGRARALMREEGVVIEVVPPGCAALSARIVAPRSVRSSVVRYVVQCWELRLLRRAVELVVVSL